MSIHTRFIYTFALFAETICVKKNQSTDHKAERQLLIMTAFVCIQGGFYKLKRVLTVTQNMQLHFIELH